MRRQWRRIWGVPPVYLPVHVPRIRAMPLTLVIGEGHSGKSRCALSLAAAHGPRLAFIATLLPLTDEAAAGCMRLRAERGDAFVTWEEPVRIVELLAANDEYFDAVVVDCLSGWLRNLAACGQAGLELAAERFAETAAQASAHVVVVAEQATDALIEAAEEVFQMREGLPVRV